MIERLDNKSLSISGKLYSLWQESYLVEAEILKAVKFPPLQRKCQGFIDSNSEFYGAIENDEIISAIEIVGLEEGRHIQSLVVHPNHFKKGLASKLIKYALIKYEFESVFTVETGLDNIPAISLYLKHGFVEQTQFDTDHGVRKIRLILTRIKN